MWFVQKQEGSSQKIVKYKQDDWLGCQSSLFCMHQVFYSAHSLIANWFQSPVKQLKNVKRKLWQDPKPAALPIDNNSNLAYIIITTLKTDW